MTSSSNTSIHRTFFSSRYVLLVTLALTSIGSFMGWLLNKQIADESSLIELGQVIFLALASGSAAIHSAQSQRTSVEGYILFGLAIFCTALMLREVDIDKLGSAAGWKTLEQVLRATAGIIALSYLGFLLRKRSLLWASITDIGRMTSVRLALFGCVMYLASWPFDKMVFDLSASMSVLIEETLELNACIIIFFASTASNLGSRQTEKPLANSPC